MRPSIAAGAGLLTAGLAAGAPRAGAQVILSSTTLPAPTTASALVTPSTASLPGVTTGFPGAPFINSGAPLTQPLPPSPYNSPGAPFNARPGLQPAAPSPVFPGVIPAPGGPTTAPSTAPQPGTPNPPHASLRLLDEANAEWHRSLATEYEKRHQALVDSDDWHAASRAERKTKLRALKDEFRGKEERLRAYYLSQRARLLQAAD